MQIFQMIVFAFMKENKSWFNDYLSLRRDFFFYGDTG